MRVVEANVLAPEASERLRHLPTTTCFHVRTKMAWSTQRTTPRKCCQISIQLDVDVLLESIFDTSRNAPVSANVSSDLHQPRTKSGPILCAYVLPSNALSHAFCCTKKTLHIFMNRGKNRRVDCRLRCFEVELCEQFIQTFVRPSNS